MGERAVGARVIPRGEGIIDETRPPLAGVDASNAGRLYNGERVGVRGIGGVVVAEEGDEDVGDVDG